MSLRNKDIAFLLSRCDLYNETIEREDYIDPWKDDPTFNPEKHCRKLREQRSLYHPLKRESNIDYEYNYRVNQPLKRSGITKYEGFMNNNDNIIKKLLIILIIIFFLVKLIN